VTSFVSGSVATFICLAPLFDDSAVLASVPPTTVQAFTHLVADALGSGRRSRLLYSSSIHGASNVACHSRCQAQGQGPTLTLIRDTDGNVFGGYTPLPWFSWIDDDILENQDAEAFLFSVCNPYGEPPALFPSIPGAVTRAGSLYLGPAFSRLSLYSGWPKFRVSSIAFGYVNTTRHRGFRVLTDSSTSFTPVDMEVWILE
jgi:hypothetical protein